MRLGLLLAVLTSIAPVARAGLEPVLIEPASSGEVAAGSTQSIAWDASDLPPNIEEWEAFLSIDGGRTYPVRLTPHLDASIRRFRWTVPNLPGAKLTIMLRFGDERSEHRFVFSLEARITGIVLLPQRTTIQTEGAGESAEEDGDGVVCWVEGARDGSRLRQVGTAGGVRLDRLRLDSLRPETARAALTSPRSRGNSMTGRSLAFAQAPRAPARAQGIPPLGAASSVLMASSRLNI